MSLVTQINTEGFKITPSAAEQTLTLLLEGSGDMAAVQPLKEALVQVRRAMRLEGHRSLAIDLRGLYLLNSSCIKALVHFVYQLQTEGPSFPIAFIVDKNLSWQPRALAAIGRMAPELVTVRNG